MKTGKKRKVSIPPLIDNFVVVKSTVDREVSRFCTGGLVIIITDGQHEPASGTLHRYYATSPLQQLQ